MTCERPIGISDPHGVRGKMYVPCGRCPACLTNKANDWVTRLRAETQSSTSAYFITLTYEDHFLPHDANGEPCFSLKDMQRLIQNLRNKVPDRLRYYYVCEYGEDKQRPHYHMILWNWPPEVDLMTALGKSWLDSKGRMMSIWLPEMVKPLVMEHIVYVTKYVFKKAEVPKGRMKPFMKCSKGIGKSLLSESVVNFYRNAPSEQVFIDGKQFYMPRYYKDKIYNDPDLKLALLSSKERYVNTKYLKEMQHDKRTLGVAWDVRSSVRTVVDPETGELVHDLVQSTYRPVGILEKLGLLSSRQTQRRKVFNFKHKEKVKKSYNF